MSNKPQTKTRREGRDLVLESIIDAPRATLFRCWTEPALMTQWFAPLPWTTPKAETDVRAGGASLVVMRDPDGAEFPSHGVYLEVLRDERLVFTDAYTSAWLPSDKPFFTGVLTFEDLGGGKTRYTARARHWTEADCDAHEKMGFHEGGAVHRATRGARGAAVAAMMKFSDRYPIIVTPHKDACRDFWRRHLGFEAGFDAAWFCWLHAGDGSASIAFMTPDHPSAPPGPGVFSGQGVCFELQVDDAGAAHAAFAASGGAVGYALTDEPFGQRRFGFADPSGLWVDVVQQIDPAAGYWDRYLQPPTR